MARTRGPTGELDTELEDLPAPARWREWMGRVEAAIFASAEPVLRDNLARVVGKACNLELVIDDIREELRGCPYEIVSMAGGWMFRTKLGFGDAIRTALGATQKNRIVARERPYPDGDRVFSADHPGGAVAVSGKRGFARCDRRAAGEGLIAAGPRSPTPGAPYAYVTTPGFLSHFGFGSLRDLPDIEKLEDAGLLGRTSETLLGGDALASELRGVLGLSGDEDEPEEDAA